ncbi:hypothetical protein L6270_01415 [Candidatus Parcubacteria bacterium]|nr:hypothetical protein [Patescibacteria group bacterium]MBU4309799.1 hypothetical protein [Patescibacteria group bacterium]MBU4431932.1 hypothetical protein [Patescibacteria group bacterium]MBU4578138.1 hypothetical protein [Patescibacteria group bacterium]MCG2696675.1 hypothetical protein [Candidatus Parcubacteria bacterium]
MTAKKIKKLFNRFVDTEDFDKSEKKSILRHLFNLSNAVSKEDEHSDQGQIQHHNKEINLNKQNNEYALPVTNLRPHISGRFYRKKNSKLVAGEK